MRKQAVRPKQLQLNRETLRDLQEADLRKVAVGSEFPVDPISCETGGACCCHSLTY